MLKFLSIKPTKVSRLLIPFALLLLPAFQLSAVSMKLISPASGWAISGSKLFWTADGGNQWTNITPIVPGPHSPIRFIDVFFRDASEGWTLVSFVEQVTGNTIYALTHTIDSGATWSSTPLTYPELPKWIQDTFAGPVSLYFLDSLHGWIDVAFAGNSKPGKLLATTDGGKTWNWINSPGFSGPIYFSSRQDGWLLGYFGGEKLYVTHDGAKTWQETRISPPPDTSSEPSFQGLPVFQNPQNGFLVVHYPGMPGTPTGKLAVYSTSDNGKTWKLGKTLSEARDASGSTQFPFAIADASIIVPTSAESRGVSLKSIPINGNGSNVAADYHGVVEMSFADLNNGWLMTTNGSFLATHDAGTTWTQVSPINPPTSSSPETVPPKKGPVANLNPNTELAEPIDTFTAAAGGGGDGSSSHISKHLGFDISRVSTVSQMQTWWQYSPYYDTSLYLPGALNRMR